MTGCQPRGKQPLLFLPFLPPLPLCRVEQVPLSLLFLTEPENQSLLPPFLPFFGTVADLIFFFLPHRNSSSTTQDDRPPLGRAADDFSKLARVSSLLPLESKSSPTSAPYCKVMSKTIPSLFFFFPPRGSSPFPSRRMVTLLSVRPLALQALPHADRRSKISPPPPLRRNDSSDWSEAPPLPSFSFPHVKEGDFDSLTFASNNKKTPE